MEDKARPRPYYSTRFVFRGGDQTRFVFREDDQQYVREAISIIDAHVETALQKSSEGWSAHLLRVRLAQYVWHDSEISVKVHAPIRNLFSKLTSRIGPHNHGEVPIMIGCADDGWTFEILKEQWELEEKGDRLGINSPSLKGLFNGLLLVPPVSRSRDTVETHFARHDFLYRRDGIDEIDVRAVATADIPRTCRRVFRGVLDGDIPLSKGLLVLPVS